MNKEYLAIVLFMFLIQVILPSSELVLVEGGEATMERRYDDGESVDVYSVEDFYISTTEVTVAEWRDFVDNTGHEFLWEGHYWGDIADLSPSELCPIQLITIYDAVAFCNWLSEQSGFQEVYYWKHGRIHRNRLANGYRLPTRDEWDFAAIGGLQTHGYEFSGGDIPEDVAWFGLSIEDGAQEVAQKTPNELGLFDMCGNIREFCWPLKGLPLDYYDTEEKIFIAGGRWSSPLEDIRLGSYKHVLVYNSSRTGFRLARNAP